MISFQIPTQAEEGQLRFLEDFRTFKGWVFKPTEMEGIRT